MPDLTTIAATFPAIAKIVDKLSDKSVKVELQSKIIELQAMMMEMQAELQQFRSSDEKNHRQAETREKLEKRENAYYLKGDDKNVAFCINCFETNAQLLPLIKPVYSINGVCSACKAEYGEVFGKAGPIAMVAGKRTNWDAMF
jgi:hypothetical protein